MWAWWSRDGYPAEVPSVDGLLYAAFLAEEDEVMWWWDGVGWGAVVWGRREQGQEQEQG